MSSHKKEFLILGVILIVAVSLIGGLPFYLKGQTFTGGTNPEPELTDAVTCESTTLSYPFFGAQSGEVGHKISSKMVFQSDELSSLGFYYDAYYDDAENARAASDLMNTRMNTYISRAGYVVGQDLNVRFYRNANDVGFSFYINRDNYIENALLQFVMLEMVDESHLKKADYISKYEAQGFSCGQITE